MTNYSIPPGYPDLEFIKQKVPIQDVARQLGLKVRGRYRAHCWRFENHRNGDRNPSITFWLKKNRGRCWICDARSFSNIDLVQTVLGFDLRESVSWIAERFPVPTVPHGKHIGKTQRWNPFYRVGTSHTQFELLVRSGIWGELTPAQKSLLPVLDVFTNDDTGDACISYRGMMRYSGIGSSATIRTALRRYQQLGLLEIERGVSGGFCSVNSYCLTFDSSKFRGIINETFRRLRDEIELERAFWAEERKRRRIKQSSRLPVQVNPFFTERSTEQIDDSVRVKRQTAHDL